MQADAFAGYNAIYEGGDMREAGCMAHARREFHDLFVARRNEVNTEALRRIGELYAIEAAIAAVVGRLPKKRPLTIPTMHGQRSLNDHLSNV
ncbi:hypothetical protein P3T22_006523 [Paraburkholderia sp. GAS348]